MSVNSKMLNISGKLGLSSFPGWAEPSGFGRDAQVAIDFTIAGC